MAYNKRCIGADKERFAIEYMQGQGYELIERNFNCHFGEIDAVFKKDGLLVVCEIKYRSSRVYGDPLEAVDIRKQRRISKTTMFYYIRRGLDESQPCRFDVLGVYRDGTINHVENAFMFIR